MTQASKDVPSFSLISTALVANSVVFLVLANAALALRLYARKIKSLRLMWDDWTIVISLVLSWIYSINTWVAAGLGGVNRTTLGPLKAAEVFDRCLLIEGVTLSVVLATVKISILLFYRRIFVTKVFKICVDILIVILAGWGISFAITHLLISSPISSLWKGGHLKYNFVAFSFTLAIMSIIFDVMVLCFPLPVIRALNMPPRRKIQISGVLWLGAFCCVAAALRLHFLHEGNQRPSSQGGHNPYTYLTRELTWSHIEPNCSIVAACLPTLGPLLVSSEPLERLMRSVRSFISLRTNFSSSYRRRKPSPSLEEGCSQSGLVMDDRSNGRWIKLSKPDSMDIGNHNVVDIAGGIEADEHDLEAQRDGTASLKIVVKKGFGTEH